MLWDGKTSPTTSCVCGRLTGVYATASVGHKNLGSGPVTRSFFEFARKAPVLRSWLASRAGTRIASESQSGEGVKGTKTRRSPPQPARS
jgi:hypothetical protein